MKCNFEGITIEGAPVELAEFMRLRRSADVTPKFRRRGKGVIIRFGEGNEHRCASTIEAYEFLLARGIHVSRAFLQTHLSTEGSAVVGRYTLTRVNE